MMMISSIVDSRSGMPSSSSSSKLVEFHEVRIWGKHPSEIESQYERAGLIEPWAEFYRKAMAQLDEILKPRPTVKPLVRRRRRVHNAPDNPSSVAIPTVSSKMENPPAPNPDVSLPTSNIPQQNRSTVIPTKPTARKSTTGRTPCPSGSTLRGRKLLKMIGETKNFRPVAINLAQTNLKRYIRPLIRQSKLNIKDRMSQKRKESTDSGVASEEEDLVRPVSAKKKRALCTSRSDPIPSIEKRQKMSNPQSHSGDKRRCNFPNGVPKKLSTPSIRVSIPLEIAVPQNGYLGNMDSNNNTTGRTSMPKDVIPSAEFDYSTLQLMQLAPKRFREPPPLQLLPPNQYSPTCIQCNVHFKTAHEKANHDLAKHPSFRY